MPSELNRRAVFAAAAAFLVALAVAYALSSTGQASEGSGPPGTPAEPLDVAAGVANNSSLGEAQALPALVVRPKPKPKPKAEPEPEPTPVDTSPAPTVESPPVQSAPPVIEAPPPPPQPTPPPVEFEDSG